MPHVSVSRPVRRPGAVAWALFAAMILGACGGQDGGDWQGTVTDSAGVSVVTSTGAGTWADGQGWTIEEDLRIGTAEGEPEYQFGLISGMDVGSDGRIYVLDQQAAEVRVFGPDGRFVARMGKSGAGPGELGMGAGPLFAGPGDTIAVADVAQQRVTRFTPTGDPAGSFPLALTEGIPIKWMELADGDLVHQNMVMAFPGQAAVEPRTVLVRRDPSGAIADTLRVMEAGQTMDFSSGQPRMTIFAPEPMWTLAPDGRLVTGNNSVYRLEIHGPDGGLQHVIQKQRDQRPITEGDREEFIRVIQQAWKDAGMPPQAMDMMTQSLNFAEYYPAYANILVGPDRTVWVQGVQTPETVREGGGTFDIQDLGGPTWEVFDGEGRLLGTVRMPPRFAPLFFEGDHLYGVLRDDLDIQYATRMSVSRGTVQG